MYTPANPPPTPDAKQITAWVYRELQRVSDALRVYDALRMNPLAVAPTKPRKGDIVYAEGTHWNPGSGEGVYVFDGSTWNML